MTTYTTPTCPMCGTASELAVTDEQALALVLRTPVQQMLPDWPREQRELVISGAHPECWVRMFGTDDDA